MTPPDVAWPGLMIAVALAARLGDSLGLDSLDGIWSEMQRLGPCSAGVPSELLRTRPRRASVGLAVADSPVLETDPGSIVNATTDPTATPGIQHSDEPAAPVTPAATADESAIAPDTSRPPMIVWSPPTSPAPVAKPDAYALR